MGKAKRVLIGIGAIIALVILWYLVVVFWHGSTKQILAVADKFQPGASWVMTSETIKPPKIICGEVDVPCPMVNRIWKNKTSYMLTRDQFANLLHETGWDFDIKGTCNLDRDAGGYTTLCYASGVVDGYDVRVGYSTTAAGHDDPHLDLNITKRTE